MSLWEYKVITSGKGGFATPALLEKFLNDLGREEWEIVHFQTQPDNFLAFTGLARRSTQRDWTLQDAAAAAAKAEAEKLRAEFEAKFKAAASPGPAGVSEESSAGFIEERAAPEDGFRKPVDTSHDDEPEDEEKDDWDKLVAAEEDELPSFFEAIKPHMRRNQRGPGMSVGVDYLAKKWDQSEDDLKGALVECGFVLPEDEDSKPEYVEYDGDLYWLNINRRGELWINTKEKPRPMFRPVKAQRIEVEAAPAKEERPAAIETKAPAAEAPTSESGGESKAETAGQPVEKPEGGRPPSAPLPEGVALLDKIRPHMRRNRRGPGGSGSASFLARALRTNEAELKVAFTALGLTMPASPNDKPAFTEIGREVWWLNIDSRGGLWINGREKREGEVIGAPAPDGATPEAGAQAPQAESAPAPAGETSVVAASSEPPAEASGGESAPASTAPAPVEAPVASTPEPAPVAPATDAAASPLAAARLLLKETKTGAVAGKVERLAGDLGKSSDELVATLVGAGLKVPEKPREKPVFVEHAGEIYWFNRNARGELWLNAKASKFADAEAGADGAEGSEGEADKPRRGGRSRGRRSAE